MTLVLFHNIQRFRHVSSLSFLLRTYFGISNSFVNGNM